MTRELFSCEPEGFPGDEDNGSMAGWYLFAMLGLYPICPGKAQYIVSRPLLPRAELQIGDKTLTIARGENGEFLLGGREITMDYISHEELIAAAV